MGAKSSGRGRSRLGAEGRIGQKGRTRAQQGVYYQEGRGVKRRGKLEMRVMPVLGKDI